MPGVWRLARAPADRAAAPLQGRGVVCQRLRCKALRAIVRERRRFLEKSRGRREEDSIQQREYVQRPCSRSGSHSGSGFEFHSSQLNDVEFVKNSSAR